MDTHNTYLDLAEFFGVDLDEFFDFWDSLTNDEQRYYRSTKLN